jgi:hypothetical protein
MVVMQTVNCARCGEALTTPKMAQRITYWVCTARRADGARCLKINVE